ncbi:DUF397 domain-containing protein [Streptomyces sp. SID3343]|uniref:DUF397 domain-containing protein n=1 Tax=Streptomyces sp. SID3343 TaxID=2690260 RepID=UPI001369CF92|nr:DUF397 domain-containing protein [Streptomyces sp. SID3343]
MPRTSSVQWRKSSYSSANSECVEVAPWTASTAVRDSKDPGIGRLVVASVSWSRLVSALKSGA